MLLPAARVSSHLVLPEAESGACRVRGSRVLQLGRGAVWKGRGHPGSIPGCSCSSRMGSKELSPPQEGRVRRFLGASCPAWQPWGQAGSVPRKSRLDEKATSCHTRGLGPARPRCPCPSQERWEGVMASPQGWHKDVPVQQLLPHTQGPRRAFKIPFITMEPSRLKSQAQGSGLVSAVAG